MKVAYSQAKFEKCPLCLVELQNQLLIPALRDLWKLASLHIESKELISNRAPDEKQEEVKKKFQETAERLYKHLDEASDEMFFSA